MTTTSPAAIQASQLRIRFNKPQRHAFRHVQPGNTVVLPWGRGCGKSAFLLLLAFILVAQHDYRWRDGMPHPGVRIVFMMPALSQARGEIIVRFVNMLTRNWKFLGGHWDKGELSATFPGGSYIHFVSQEQDTFLRSRRADVVLVDEADDIRKPVYKDVVSPWLSETFSLAMRIVGGTPRQGRNGLLYRLFSAARDRAPRHFGRKATWRDVPEHVSAAFVAGERAAAVRDGALPAFYREWECDFDSAEGIVYPSFDQTFHVRDRDPRVLWTDMLVGVDHGFTHPGVFLLIGVAGKGDDAMCHVLDEVSETQKDDPWWAAKCDEWVADYPDAHWFADPSQPTRIATFKARGARIVQANNHVQDGLSEVSKRLAIWETEDGTRKSRLYIAPRCVKTITCLDKYRRKRDRAGNIMEEPEEVDDDEADALRYGLHTHFNGPPNGRNSAGWDARQ